jgi:hypothetical protein
MHTHTFYKIYMYIYDDIRDACMYDCVYIFACVTLSRILILLVHRLAQASTYT